MQSLYDLQVIIRNIIFHVKLRYWIVWYISSLKINILFIFVLISWQVCSIYWRGQLSVGKIIYQSLITHYLGTKSFKELLVLLLFWWNRLVFFHLHFSNHGQVIKMRKRFADNKVVTVFTFHIKWIIDKGYGSGCLRGCTS